MHSLHEAGPRQPVPFSSRRRFHLQQPERCRPSPHPELPQSRPHSQPQPHLVANLLTLKRIPHPLIDDHHITPLHPLMPYPDHVTVSPYVITTISTPPPPASPPPASPPPLLHIRPPLTRTTSHPPPSTRSTSPPQHTSLISSRMSPSGVFYKPRAGRSTRSELWMRPERRWCTIITAS